MMNEKGVMMREKVMLERQKEKIVEETQPSMRSCRLLGGKGRGE